MTPLKEQKSLSKKKKKRTKKFYQIRHLVENLYPQNINKYYFHSQILSQNIFPRNTKINPSKIFLQIVGVPKAQIQIVRHLYNQ